MNSDFSLPVQNRLRWLWTIAIICQVELITLLLLFSVRSVWSFINGYIDRFTGLNEFAFPVVFSFLILLFSLSVIYLVFQITLKKHIKAKISYPAIIFFVFQLIVFLIILSRLYPDLESMYLSQLPYWLHKEGVLFFSITVSTFLMVIFLLKYKKRKDVFLTILISVNGILAVGVLSFAYMAITVRSIDFGSKSLKSEFSNTTDYFKIDSRNPENFTADSLLIIHPDLSLKLDMDYGGNYLIAGDVTGDGIVEIITLKMWVETHDINRIKSLAVQSLLTDSVTGERGKTLWTWQSKYPAPENIGGGRGSSAAITVFDLETGLANRKLLMSTDGWLYEFTFNSEGFVSEKKVPTGTVNSSDCLIIANLEGNGRHHILLKDAYHTIWAYDKNLNLMWKTRNPGGYLLAHRIGAYDLNNDGIDEILAGATILNSKGEVISTLKTNTVKLWYGGHIDGIVPIQQNGKWHISVTYCDGLGFALFDADGNCEWEITGDHFEYLVGGYFYNTPELKDEFQLISKVHYKSGDPQVMMNQDGRLLGVFEPSSTVFPVDWNGDGYHEMVFNSPASVFSENKKIADLYIPENENSFTMRVADITGRKSIKPDGIPDIALRTINEKEEQFLYFYTNKKGKSPVNYVYPGIGWESAANYFTKYFEYNR